jgi:hypothetical protein
MSNTTNVTTSNTPLTLPHLTEKVTLDHIMSAQTDYALTGLGLGKWIYEDGEEVYYDLYSETYRLMTKKQAIAHLPKMRQRGTLNLRFADDEMQAFLKSIRSGNTKAMWTFFERYAVVLAELYPTTDIMKILSQELISCISTKGIKVSKMFENFFTLMLQVRPTPDQYLEILEILHPSDVQKITQLFGFLGSFNIENTAEEQILEFFTNAGRFMQSAADTSDNFKVISERANTTIETLTTKLESIIAAIKETMRTNGPLIETLGFIGTILVNTYENLPYVLGKLALMATQGCTVERLVDILSVTGILKHLLTSLGDKFAKLLLTGPEEQMNLGPFLNKLCSPEGLMSFWKLDRGVVGLLNLCEHLKSLLSYLGIVPNAERDRIIKIAREMDDIELVITEYNARLINDPRSLLDPRHLRVLENYRDTLKNIYSTLEILKDLNHRQRCNFLKLEMAKLHTTVMILQRSAHSRPEPIGICTLGAGGIGKSTLVSATPKLLAARVAERRMRPAADPKHLPEDDEFLDSIQYWQSWSQNQNDQYFSGYIGQEFHNVDDGFQDRTDADHLAYFNLISAVPFPTNQADLASKGRPYTSRVVQVSANSFPVRSETVRDVKALARRFTIIGVKFHDETEYANWLRGERAYDNSFRHLKFFAVPGYDYVNNNMHQVAIGGRGWVQITLNQYLDIILDGCMARQATFLQRTAAEQADEDFENPIQVDMNQWQTYLGTCTGVSSGHFFDLEGNPISEITPTDKDDNFQSALHRSYLGRLASTEFENLFDCDKVVAYIHAFHSRHLGRIFTSTRPVDFIFQTPHKVVTISFPQMGPYCDSRRIITVEATPQEDIVQYADQFTEIEEEDIPIEQEVAPTPRLESKSFYARFVALLEKLFQGATEMVNLVLYAVKKIFFPDMTGWTDVDKFCRRFTEIYLLLFGFIVLLGYFFGLQTLGSAPTCRDCNGSIEKNLDLIVQWALANKIHSRKCKFYRCCDECRWLKSQRFTNTSSCKNEVGVLFWKKPCAYASDQDQIEKIHKILRKLHEEDPAEYDPYGIASFIVEKVKLPPSSLYEWMAQVEQTYMRAFSVSTTYTNVEEEGEDLKQLNVFLVDPASFENSSESKRIIRKRAQMQSGESKKIVRKRAAVESGESKRIVRKHAKCEAAFTQKTIPCSDGSNATAHIRLPGSCLDLEAFEEFNKQLDCFPSYADKVAEEYGLKLTKINPDAFTVESNSSQEQASADPNCRSQAGGINECAVYVLSATNNIVLRGIPVSTDRFIVPSHLTKVYPVGESFPIAYKNGVYSAHIEKMRPSWDIAVAVIEGARVQLTSQYKFIPDEAELVDRLRSNSRAIICIPNQEKQTFMINVNMTLHKEYRIAFADGSDKSYDHLWVATNLVSMGADTNKGDCGSPVMLLCPKTQRKLVGFHIVGARDYSAFAVLTRERVLALLPSETEEVDIPAPIEQVALPPTTYETVPNDLSDTLKVCESEDPIYAPVGEDKIIVGKRAFEMPSAGKTAIAHHPCHGAFPVKTIPAYLSDAAFIRDHPDTPLTATHPNGDEVQLNLVTKNTSKWCKKLPQSDLITSELAEMEEELTNHWLEVFSEENLSMISMEDAVSGNPAFDLEPMNIKSSPGIPYNTLKGMSSKANLIEATGKSYMNGKQQLAPVSLVKDNVLKRIELAKDSKRPFSLWKDCLKDETRPIEKVNQGKTRIFTAAPFDFSIAVRVMMGRFKAVWQKKGAQLGHSVGIDCISPDWGQLYARLAAVSDHGFDCDYSSYDGNLRADFMQSAIRIFAKVIADRTVTTRYGVTKDQVETIINVICSECIETYQQSGDVVWLSKHGNPSGNPLTTELNCTVNFMYHWFCFRQILGADACSLRDFFEKVGFACFGDDAIFVFQDVDLVTFADLARWMNYLGQDYTNASKTGSDSELMHITELSFLKRRFKLDDASKRIIQSPIEEDSITGQFNWCSYPSDSVDIIQDTYENALIEAAQLGRERFEKFVTQLYPMMNSHLKLITGAASVKPTFKSYRYKLNQKLVK